jgi:tellurite resistance protein TerC
MDSIHLWIIFTLAILGLLALDLGIFQRKPHVIGTREALGWFGFWMLLAFLFNIGIALFHARKGEAATEFLTGFLVEKALSIDNIFVFILIFGYFNVPKSDQHKILFWGIIGAIVLRAGFIIGGLALIENFHWTIYFFGTFLLLTGLSMMRGKDKIYDPGNNRIIRMAKRIIPVTDRYESGRFFVRHAGKLVATPMFIVLLAIESSDIIFAVDSIPAIFSITSDPFIVYTSNIFAMLGLRSLYFAVSGFIQMFHFLHYGFASIIVILGIKMLVSNVYHIPVGFSLALVIVVLLVCIIVSLLRPRKTDLKIMFQRTEKLGLIPFRRLLLLENIIDLGDLRVRDSMRHKSGVRLIRMDRPWAENAALLRETRLSRYPVVTRDNTKPIGYLHVKNLPPDAAAGTMNNDQLKALVKPCLEMPESLPLEDALARFQRRFEHLALVVKEDGEWSGIISMEDILEEIVGKIGDEFDSAREERSVMLADAVGRERIVLNVQAVSMADAIETIVRRIPGGQLPVNPETIIRIVLAREMMMPTYLGKGLSVPHARIEGIDRPVLIFARSADGIPQVNTNERAELIFLLLTPVGTPRMQARLLADIAGLVDSDYVAERLRKADTPEEVIEAIRAGQQVVLD